MGPIALFDKSFLQSLTLDESVWFDHFFITNVCPIFYVETLADLEKPSKKRSSEDEVRIIAEKFPSIGSIPCSHHIDLAHDNLLGYYVPMTGQIPAENARLVQFNGKVNVISEHSPISDAFRRWKNTEFNFVERQYASYWRSQLSKMDLTTIPKLLTFWKDFNKRCKTLKEVHNLVLDFINSKKASLLRLEIFLRLLEVSPKKESKVRSRWVKLGYPSAFEFAPYAAYVISIIIFFQLSIRSGLIDPNRASNLTDIAYLFYLPFSMIFISSDKLHKHVTPLFLRPDQEFVWGFDLKKSLKEINIYYSCYPDSEKEKGLWALAPTPPMQVLSLIAELWDRHLLDWRKNKQNNSVTKIPFEDIEKNIKQIEKTPTLKTEPGEINTKDINSAIKKRKAQKKKGSWYLFPKDISN